MALDDRRSVLVQVLLRGAFSRGDRFKILEVELEVLGATEGEVLYLACLSRLLLDGGTPGEEGATPPGTLSALRPGGGIHGPHTHGMLILAVYLA